MEPSGNVSADGGVLLARIRGIEETFRSGCSLYVDQEGAGLAGNSLVLVIDGEDPVHAHHGHHDTAVFAVGTAGEACARSADNNGNVVFVTVFHDRRDLLLGDDFYVEFRGIGAVVGHLIVIIIFGNIFTGFDAVGSSDASDVIEVGGVHFLIRISHSQFLSMKTHDEIRGQVPLNSI